MQEYTLEQKLPADYQNGSTLKAFTLNQFRWHQIAMSDDLEALEEYAGHCFRIGVELRIVDRRYTSSPFGMPYLDNPMRCLSCPISS